MTNIESGKPAEIPRPTGSEYVIGGIAVESARNPDLVEATEKIAEMLEDPNSNFEDQGRSMLTDEMKDWASSYAARALWDGGVTGRNDIRDDAEYYLSRVMLAYDTALVEQLTAYIEEVMLDIQRSIN